jgi:hypothetical protein
MTEGVHILLRSGVAMLMREGLLHLLDWTPQGSGQNSVSEGKKNFFKYFRQIPLLIYTISYYSPMTFSSLLNTQPKYFCTKLFIPTFTYH